MSVRKTNYMSVTKHFVLPKLCSNTKTFLSCSLDLVCRLFKKDVSFIHMLVIFILTLSLYGNGGYKINVLCKITVTYGEVEIHY